MISLRKMRLRNKLLLGFAIPAVLTMTLSTVFYNSVNRLVHTFNWVDHTHTAIGYGNTLLSAMIDMETGLRGFLVAGDTVFLEPYDGGKIEFRETLETVRRHVSDNPGQLARLDEIALSKDNWLSDHAMPAIALRQSVVDSASGDSNGPSMTDVSEFIGRGLGKKSMDNLRALIADFNGEEEDLIVNRTDEVMSVASLTKVIALVGALIFVLVSVIVVILITRNVGRQLGTEPATVETIANNIAQGDLSQDLHTHKPATGVFAAMQVMQKSLKDRLEHDQKISEEMTRIKQALDSTSSPVLVTDESLIVIYENRAATNLFKRLEPELQSVVSAFSAKNLIGSSIEQFRKEGGTTRAELEQLTSSLEQSTKFAAATLAQVYSPVTDKSGNRIGTVVEFKDVSKQLAVEEEIQSVVDAVLVGDLGKRLNLDDKSGFHLLLSERMNALVSICDNIIDDTVRVFGAMSRYDLTESITEDYQGSFAEVKSNANKTIAQLTGIISDVRSDASMLDSASARLKQLNDNMHYTAETSSDQASNVSSAASQISNNISGVASASTQMNASISEIARNSSDATQIAGDAVSLAESTETTVRKLSDSSNDIGNVIKVINSIAEQTNLLALNATIEAARAGDAGKGFAVVANEVKELAKETAKATDEIVKKVATIQTDSDSAVGAIGNIDKTIQKINDIQVMIASAVEEQKATTNEISRSVNEAAAGSMHIAENSASAANGALQALSSTSEAQQSTSELAQLATELYARVEQFKVKAA